MQGVEAVNDLFRFDCEVLSVNTMLNLAPLLGEPFTLRLLLADGSYRAWQGYCTEARWEGTDGGIARYKLRLEPFLAFLRLRTDSFIFQGKTTLDIITEMMADYPQAHFRFEVSRTLPVREICTQYRESDLDFIARILARDGLSYRFEHDQTGADALADDSASLQAAHTMVIFDHLAQLPDLQSPDLSAGRSLRFAGMRAADSEDAVDGFTRRHQVVTTRVATSSWLFSQVSAHSGEADSPILSNRLNDSTTLASTLPSALPALQAYSEAGHGQFANATEADDWAQCQSLAYTMENVMLDGEGAVRGLSAGCTIDLTGHDADGLDATKPNASNGADGFKVLSVQHEAVNNLGAGFQHNVALADAEEGTYRNRFTAIPADTAVLPSASRRLMQTNGGHSSAMPRKSVALGPQTALVVGLPDAITTSSRDHQVRIQFHWQRGESPHAGGLTETGNAVDTIGNAPNNETSGTWVRVAESIAGPNYGGSFTPRIGCEVLVDFMHGDLDQPIIVAALYNGVDTPPFSAGIDGGLDHGGVVSGWHTHNFSGDGYNQWLVDDMSSQLQTQLLSSSANSALNLGFLRARSPASAARGLPRGLGLEARTDAWGHVRGEQGVLLSTTLKPQLGSSVHSFVLDTAEATAQLNAATALNKAIRDSAVAQGAQVSDIALQTHPDHTKKISPAQGSEAQQALRFERPVVALESAANVNQSSAGSQLLFAQQHLSWTTQGDSHWVAKHTASMNSGEATTLYTHAGGMTFTAAHAPVSLAAHTNALEMLSDQSTTVTSTDAAIVVEAQHRITLQAGQSSIVLEGGDITIKCPGNFSVKGGSHPFTGGGSDAARLERLPDTREKLYDEQVRAMNELTGEPIPFLPYKIQTAEGEVFYGETDEDGKTIRIATMQPQKITVFWGEREKLASNKSEAI
jgi:type VI secretion system secreted protein VgrG